MNYTCALALIAILISGLAIPFESLADVSPPKKQTNVGITPDKVICAENLFKVISIPDGKPRCVKPQTAIKLIERGLATSSTIEQVEKFIGELSQRVIPGTVKKIGTIKIDASSKFFRSNAPATAYKVLFEICAKEKTLKAPEVILTSQTATSYVKLATDIPPNSCEINTGIVAALNPDTIQVTLENEGGITQKITQLESTVSELKQKLESEKTLLSTRVQEGDKAKQSERIDSIAKMRADLNQAREELNRYLFALYMTPQTKSQTQITPKTFTGAPIEGVTVNLLATHKQLVGEGFDVAFEMCAADQPVRIPTVLVSSDIESKAVKLSDRIIPNSCQISGAKIMSSSPDTIQVSIGDTGERSANVAELENKITELVNALAAEKDGLRKLTHLAPRPADFNDQAAKITDSILELRVQITAERALLYSLLNQIYS